MRAATQAISLVYDIDEDGDWGRSDVCCMHPRTAFVAQAMLQYFSGNVDIVRVVVHEWKIAEILLWKRKQSRDFMATFIISASEVHYPIFREYLWDGKVGEVVGDIRIPHRDPDGIGRWATWRRMRTRERRVQELRENAGYTPEFSPEREYLMPKFEDLMEKLFLNNGCDIWPIARVYAATFVSTSLRRRSVLPAETRDLVRECAVRHFFHGTDVDAATRGVFMLHMLGGGYDTVARYPPYVFGRKGIFASWLP